MNKTLPLSLIVVIMSMIISCKPAQQTVPEKFEMPHADDIAMYEVNPRVFAPQQSIKAITARIDSIDDLGVNVMWMMPIYSLGKEKSKNSPFCIRDYKNVDPEFGTIDDLKELVNACHERGIGFVLGWVGSHTAWDHPWIKEHPDWYFRDAKTGAVLQSKPTDRYDVADLDYSNHEMRRAMIDAMKFWVTEVGIDGFHCNLADDIPEDFWKTCIRELREAAGDRELLMLSAGQDRENFTDEGFDMNYGWQYKHKLNEVFHDGLPASVLFDIDKTEYDSLPKGKVKMRFTSGHDDAKMMAPCVEFVNQRGAMAAFVASIFMHGGAMIYSSQEVGYDKPVDFFKYEPINWTANPKIYQEFKAIFNVYNNHLGLRRGTIIAYPDDNVLAIERDDVRVRHIVFINLRNEVSVFKVPGDWVGHRALNLMNDRLYDLKPVITLKPYEYIILEY